MSSLAPTLAPPAVPRPVPVLAAFDVDGTLTRRDSLLPFLGEIAGRSAVRSALLGAVATTRPAFGAGVWRERVKGQLLHRILAGVPERRAQQAGRIVASRIVAANLRPDTWARLRWHRACGHRVVLVSAALAVYLRPLAVGLDAETALGTELEVDPEGRLTGRVRGGFCTRAAKPARLSTYLGEQRSELQIWAYGNSAQDQGLLRWADTPFWTQGVTLGTMADPGSTRWARESA